MVRLVGTTVKKPAMTKTAPYSRESLYRPLSADGNPSLATLLKVTRALGVRLHTEAA